MKTKTLHQCPCCKELYSNFMQWNCHIASAHKEWRGDRSAEWKTKTFTASECCNWVYLEKNQEVH